MLVEPRDAREISCPYIDGNLFKQRFCFLKDLNPVEFNTMLELGWRHFGYYFFMPNCNSCDSCISLRTLINSFKPTKSQRKILRKNNENLSLIITDLNYSDEIFEIYKKHSKVKFNQECSKKEFIESFFSDALMGNSKLSLYRYKGILVGVGFIDISADAISSIYFCYDPEYSKFGLGIYSALKEIEYGKELSKKYYYMGYYVEGNKSMEYKNRFAPLEYLDWSRNKWEEFTQNHTVLLHSKDTSE